MSLSEGFSWSYGDWHFTGYSLAGITTSIFFRNAGICFDVGQGLPFQNSAKHILITHAHMDHASGIPYLLSQKNMNGQKESRILVPESFEKPIREIIRLWQQVDGHVYDFDLISAKPGLVYELDRLYSAKPFLTPHRVSSQGYIVYQKKKRLKAEYRALNEDQIRELKKKGEVPSESFLDPIVAFTGDTKKEFLQSDADISLAKVLFVEVTFWDHAKSVAHARHWGHMHFDELLEILPELENERIVLIHASVRYSTRQLEDILDERIPPSHRSRVVLFPRPV